MATIHRYAITAALIAALAGTAAAAAMLSNNPIPGVDVVVKKQPGGSAFTVKTDDKGSFVLKRAVPGSYEVTLDAASLRRGVLKVDGDPRTPDNIVVKMGLLLPAVQAAREASRSAAYDAKGSAKAMTFTFDLPAPCKVGRDRGCTGKADYRGTVTLVSAPVARMDDANTAMGEISTTR